MKKYKLFFSWQSDREEASKAISAYLEEITALLSTEEAKIIIMDTSHLTDYKNIDERVLQSIQEADIFVGDVTPVSQLYLPDTTTICKLMPNSNVMFEYGYAFRELGHNRAIPCAILSKGQSTQCLPFDFNHSEIVLFKEGEKIKLDKLTKRIQIAMKEADEHRSPKCDVVFADGTTLLTLEPHFESRNNSSSSILPPLFRSGQNDYTTANAGLIIRNISDEVLENCNLTLNFNINSKIRFSSPPDPFYSSLVDAMTTYPQNCKLKIRIGDLPPGKAIKPISLKCPNDPGQETLNWALSSKKETYSGTLRLNIDPKYENE